MFSILYVDDEPGLLEIGKIFLEQDEDFTVETAEYPHEALARIKDTRYDAIVSDYQMPAMDGITFLKMVRSASGDAPPDPQKIQVPSVPMRKQATPADTPFILFTGRGREEVVIEAINSGVDFYIQKGGEPKSQFIELRHKIRQAIRRKKAEDSLYENEERLRFALEGANDGLWDVELPSGKVYLSPRGCEILGYTFEELPLIAKIWNDLVNPLDMPATQFALEQYLQGKTEVFEVEQRLLMKSGDWKWVLARGKVVERDAAGSPVRMTGTHTDITERKRAEEAFTRSESRYRWLYNSLMDAIVSVDMTGMIQESNPAYQRMLGYSAEELAVLTYRDLTPEKWHTFENKIIEQQIMPEGFSDVYEKEYRRKDGTIIPVELRSFLIRDDSGNSIGISAIVRDITERKKAESDLLRAKKEWEVIFRAIGNPTVILDAENKILEVNDAVLKKTGKTADELIGLKCWQVFHNSNAAGPPECCPFEQLKKSGSTETAEMENEALGGIYLISCTPVRDDTGHLEKVIHIAIDITGKKQMETRLRESEETFRTVADFTYNWEYWVNPEDHMIYCSPSCERITGYTQQDFLKDPRLRYTLVHPDDRIIFETHVHAVTASHKVGAVDFRIISKNNEVRWISHICQAVFDSDGKYLGRRASNRDITEKKQMNSWLRESEEKYRSVIESIPIGMHFYQLEPDGRLIFQGANPAADTMLGISHDSLNGKTIEEAFPPLTATEIPEQYRRVAREGSVWQTEQVDYDDELIRGAFSVLAFQIGQNQMVAAFFDITIIKKAQQALEASERQYRTILDSIQDIFYRTDANGTLIMVSPSGVALFGYTTADEMIGRPATDFYADPEDRKKFIEEIRNTGNVSQMEVTLKRRDGTPVAVSTSSHVYYDTSNNFAGLEGIFRDLTQLNQTRAKLHESVEKYRTLVQHIQDGVFLMQNGVILFCNDVFATMVGYSPDEITGIPIPSLVAPEDRDMVMERYRSRLEGKPGSASYEFHMLHKDGSTRVPVRMSVGIGMYRGKKASIGTVRTITQE